MSDLLICVLFSGILIAHFIFAFLLVLYSCILDLVLGGHDDRPNS
jgi:hypothetical protein